MQLIGNKLLLFGGKGGVGKTRCATATAIYAASKGKKTLILSTDPAHSLSDSFEKEIGNKITKIKNNLDALEIDAKSLLKDYKIKYGELIKQIADEGTFFSKEDIQEFFDLSLPGMDELMALVKIIDILEEDKYDLLILDTAPTGHTIRLLELPQLMTSYVKVLAEMRQKHRVVVSMMVGKYVKDKADEFIEKMNDYNLKINPNSIEIYKRDSRHLQVLDRVDFIITNPPNFSFDFSRCFKIYFWWLELGNINTIDSWLIGTKKIHSKVKVLNINFADELISKIEEKRKGIALALSKYYYDMKNVFINLYNLLKDNKYCCVYCSDSILYGNSIRCPDTFVELAKQIGFKLANRIKRTIPKKILIFAREDKVEELLVFRK